MPISMTGFGRASIDASFGTITVEIQSVNRKYLEVFVAMPKELSRFEPEVRKWVGELISRGQISVRVFLTPNVSALEGLLPDSQMLKKLKKKWVELAKEIGDDPKSIDLHFLMQNLSLQPKQELGTDLDLSALQDGVSLALKNLLKMKKSEGKAIDLDLTKRLKELEKLVSQIETQAPDATKKMRQKLFEKIGDLLKATPDVEERLLREVALFAERVDITEEITRLYSHFDQLKSLLNSKEISLGRKMEFLIQEIGRETNTIGAKSMDAKISHMVVDMKSELEKIREQIQNIE